MRKPPLVSIVGLAAVVMTGFPIRLAAQEGGTAPESTLTALLAEAVAATRPTARETHWQKIPWRPSLQGAIAEAKRAGKPVYYFGADGVLSTGNC